MLGLFSQAELRQRADGSTSWEQTLGKKKSYLNERTKLAQKQMGKLATNKFQLEISKKFL